VSSRLSCSLNIFNQYIVLPRSLTHRSAAARFLGLRVRIPSGYGYLSLVSVICCQVEVSTIGRSLVQGSPTEFVCVCVSLSVIRCNSNPPYLHGVGRRLHTKKERNKQKNSQANKESYMNVWFLPCLLHVSPISLPLIQPHIVSILWQTFYDFLYGSYAFSL
jgi:hypothetical protein